MRTIITTLLFICIAPSITSAQDKEEPQVFTKIEIEAHPEQPAKWTAYLQKQSQLPDRKQAITFVITEG